MAGRQSSWRHTVFMLTLVFNLTPFFSVNFGVKAFKLSGTGFGAVYRLFDIFFIISLISSRASKSAEHGDKNPIEMFEEHSVSWYLY